MNFIAIPPLSTQSKEGASIFSQPLFLFVAIATRTTIRVFVTGIAYVDFAKGTKIACAVVLTFRYTATDAFVNFVHVFVHHI